MDECSSCLTSITLPSLKDHLTMSVSSLAPLTYSDLEMADQNLSKSYRSVRVVPYEAMALLHT